MQLVCRRTVQWILRNRHLCEMFWWTSVIIKMRSNKRLRYHRAQNWAGMSVLLDGAVIARIIFLTKASMVSFQKKMCNRRDVILGSKWTTEQPNIALKDEVIQPVDLLKAEFYNNTNLKFICEQDQQYLREFFRECPQALSWFYSLLKGRTVDPASISCMSLFCALFSMATMKMASFAPNSCPVTFYALHLDENAKFWTSSLSCNIRTICPWNKKNLMIEKQKYFYVFPSEVVI